MQNSEQAQKPSSIFFIEVDKIRPNPLQPRREFDETKLGELSESIRQYGVLQPLVVVRTESTTPTGVATGYELIAGERRLRASKLAGLREVPVIIREEPADKVKLEMALVENVQREDLSAMDRAEAFKKLNQDFGLTHKEIGMRIGRSREYVANTVRLLSLPAEAQTALREGHITEGHARPLLMLAQQPLEQKKLLEDILYRNISVREAEKVSRHIAGERARKKPVADPLTRSFEEKLRETLGTRVSIERKGMGGRISIDFFSDEELGDLISKFVKDFPRRPPENEAVLASISGDRNIFTAKDNPEPSKEETKSPFPEKNLTSTEDLNLSFKPSSNASSEDAEEFTI